MLYQHDVGGRALEEILASFDPISYFHENTEPGVPVRRDPGEARQAFSYAKRLVRGTLENREEIDELIREQAENWRLERMPVVDRNILRLAVFELLYEEEIPHLVVLDEAIELAKLFGAERSGRFVNGLLDGLLRTHTFPGTTR